MGGKAGRVATGIATGGLSEVARGATNLVGGDVAKRALLAGGTMGLSEFAQKNPYGVNLPFKNPLASVFGNGQGDTNPYVSGPFSLDPAQMAADQAAITGLGQKQYDQTISELPKVVGNAMNLQIPGIEEKLNSQHLLNSTALQQELGRQQAELTQQIAIPALQALHGTQQGALGRGLSLEDFINQANIAKTIGAQTAPQVGNGKGQTGALLSGIGSIAAPAAKLATK